MITSNFTKKIKPLASFVFMAMIGFSACDKVDDNPDFTMDVPVNVPDFKLNGTEGVINQKTGEIVVDLPFGNTLTALKATADLPQGATISPVLNVETDFTQPVNYRIVNGNLFKNYKVTAKVLQPILALSVNGVAGNIDNFAKTISVVVPDGTNLKALTPQITLSKAVTINPASGASIDFSQPVEFTLTGVNNTVAKYIVTVRGKTDSKKLAFLGTAGTRSQLTNADEKAAANWFFATYPDAEYLSFSSIQPGKDLSAYSIIWWHFDSSMDLPAAATNATVVNKLKTYRADGGTLLLTTFAAKYLEVLGIIPAGKGPNNVFGDFLPNGFIDVNNNWGISFKGKENHPLFAGLQTYQTGKAYFLEKGTFRLNHTAWWFLPEWGGYGNSANWRQQTGGINLASEAWDDNLDGRVTIAEFPGSATDGNVVTIEFGAYDWYNENNSASNGFMPNIERLTANTIKYLSGK